MNTQPSRHGVGHNVDRIGYFDSIRKGADAEYAFRLRQPALAQYV